MSSEAFQVVVVVLAVIGAAICETTIHNRATDQGSRKHTQAVHPFVGTITTWEDPPAARAVVAPMPRGILQDATTTLQRARGSRGFFRSMEELCFEILQIPEQHRMLARKLRYEDTQYMRCNSRCVGLLGGFSSDEDGINLDACYRKLHESIGSSMNREQFIAERSNCLASIPEDTADVPVDACDKFYHMYMCLRSDYELLMTVSLED